MRNVKWLEAKSRPLLFSFFMIIFLFVVNVPTVWSHAFVIEQSPAPNSYHEHSPSEVKIVFNSKVEKDPFTIQLINEQQEVMMTQSAKISDNQKELRLQLPALDGGRYQVKYLVISSSDGHSIQGSFGFQVAKSVATNEQVDGMKEDEIEVSPPVQQPLEEVIDNTGVEKTASTIKFSNVSGFIIYMMRAIYYFGLLFLIGWIFLWRVVQHYASDVKKNYLFWGIMVQMLHLVGLLSMILIQLNSFAINGLFLSLDFPLQTNFGLFWFVSLFMSLLGFICLFKNQWFDIFWILVIVFSKSLNGHALEFEPIILLVITNSIHLFAASVWAAGLLFIILFWRKHILYVTPFLLRFSKYAFLSIVMLLITGILISYVYLSGFDLLFSSRGILLLIKTAIVLLVILMGMIIRFKMREMKTAYLKKWIKLDFLLMFLIIVIVSILTYLNPLP